MKPAALLTTNVVGGLGNQLFLLANLLATSRRSGIPAFVEPVAFSSSAAAPRPTYWSSVFRELEQHGVRLTSRSRASSPALPLVNVPEMRPVHKIELDAKRACLYNMVGFFQCEEFFNDYPVLRSVVPAELWKAAQHHLRRHYRSDACHTVALHVRRGDYADFRDIFEQLEVEYYDAAVRQLLGGLLYRQQHQPYVQRPAIESATPPSPSLHLLLFCDDVRVAQTMAGYFSVKYKGLNVSVVSPELEAKRNNSEDAVYASSPSPSPSSALMPRDVLELLMMAQCNDVVMANSTFSWWGAYFNRVPLRRVVAPSRWFVKDPYPASNHLYCPGWMLI
ncbi:putative mitochondrial hypothetical protein [Leptomonas pyrrhocoris]|uniref:Alpha-1,2-fucosyltransferase n=1 Tax=Leptomonas pyrrhocoris TaxID=157538 RepID=A0A0M9FP09_LEPPY|nr:putative mitochondrial hypothetical protein [Leptomonas pyrrhocoris]XP_015651590.1 putative mitochondrial hypothetical protein [Leptomonas pyrrhocoris]KPA73150.1 putative mitochondrial hypothetical protein [Leptomonas pyrrhocoris]KPA73151.1 putative mitochondrial hypothetical protein [Leptomonas pyrrhocoris]|eukprot:XP_015651589.1 putative mitochondrial hypothetical protein [Leptomonas pyrrhocoris]